jgi:hypothetical protein
MISPSTPTTQRSWIFDDYGDDNEKQAFPSTPQAFPSTPRTPQSLYISVNIEKIGAFLSLNDHARKRALIHQKKQADADSARSTRRRTIFDAVKSVIMDDSDDESSVTQGCTNGNSFREERGKQPQKEDFPNKTRYQRRGSCTKFSLEAELLSGNGILDDEAVHQPIFQSFRKGAKLQCDSIYSNTNVADDSDESNRSSRISDVPFSDSQRLRGRTTIDQLPIPLRGSRSRSCGYHEPSTIEKCPLPLAGRIPPSRPHHAPQTPPIHREKRASSIDRSSPGLCMTAPISRPGRVIATEDSRQRMQMPKLRHVSNVSPSTLTTSLRTVSLSPNDRTSRRAEKIRRNLPPVPFGTDPDDYSSTPHSKNWTWHNSSQTLTRDSDSSYHGSDHDQNSKVHRNPKTASSLKRRSLHRQDSVTSFADESVCDEGSFAGDHCPSMELRVRRRSSVCAPEPDLDLQKEQPKSNGLRKKWPVSRRSPSPASRLLPPTSTPATKSSPASTKQRNRLPPRPNESDHTTGASPVSTKRTLLSRIQISPTVMTPRKSHSSVTF